MPTYSPTTHEQLEVVVDEKDPLFNAREIFTIRQAVSPRRVFQQSWTTPSVAIRIAEQSRALIEDWFAAGCPTPPQVPGLPAGTIYLAAFGKHTVYLVKKRAS